MTVEFAKNSQESRVWACHCKGLSISQIARRLKMSELMVHEVILTAWRMM